MRVVSRTIDFAAIGAWRGFIDMPARGIAAASVATLHKLNIRTDRPRCPVVNNKTTKLPGDVFVIDILNYRCLQLYPAVVRNRRLQTLGYLLDLDQAPDSPRTIVSLLQGALRRTCSGSDTLTTLVTTLRDSDIGTRTVMFCRTLGRPCG
jgi:hypothetical protein